MTKPSKNYGFVRCDSEFEAVGQDLDMSTMGIVKGIPMYQMPDISRELMLLEEQLKFSAKGKEDKHMLAIGTKVIVRTCDDYGGRHCGRVGMVCKHFAKDKKVGVMFEGIKNTASKGCGRMAPRRFPPAERVTLLILTPASARPLPKRCSALRGQRSVFSRTFLRLLPPKKRKPFLKRRDKPSYHC